VPAQLPPAIVTFAGRDREVASLNDILARTPEDTGPVVVTISGTAGVGKTALAVHWAHRVKQRFPDGQLYVDLRGFSPGGSTMDPAEAVRGFLDALGVPHHRVPESPQAQVSLYRSTVASKRMLILADNARDEGQVRPLLPGAPGCLVVVTSRSQLAGLVAADAANPLSLERPSAAGARQILGRRLGTRRLHAEAEAVDDIITSCARLPLALAVAAARAALMPTFPLAELATQLRDAASMLSPLYGADPATNLGSVFSWSYQTLSDPAARLFRLMGPCPGPDITVPAAASLTGLPATDVRALLVELGQAQLITETSPGRYGFHDLLRAYAIELTERHESVEHRSAARHRFLDHFLHTAHSATLLLRPARDPITLPAPADGVTPEPLADRDAALTWFQAEHAVLLAAVARPTDNFEPPHLATRVDAAQLPVDPWLLARQRGRATGGPGGRGKTRRPHRPGLRPPQPRQGLRPAEPVRRRAAARRDGAAPVPTDRQRHGVGERTPGPRLFRRLPGRHPPRADARRNRAPRLPLGG
jgi:hypothetical protein